MFIINLECRKVVLNAFPTSWEVNESRIAPLPYRESRSRQGFGRGKSITYGRLSLPLSAFNHTLCEQNIKTCPFVCRRRLAKVWGAGEVAKRFLERRAWLTGERILADDVARLLAEFTWNKVLRGVLIQKYGLVLHREEDWRPLAPVINFAALLSGRKFELKVCWFFNNLVVRLNWVRVLVKNYYSLDVYTLALPSLRLRYARR